MDFLERRKTVVVEHEIVVNGVVHKERKEVTTITPLCESCHPYEEGKCPCPEAKGPVQTVRKHECHIGDDFVQVTEVSSDDEVVDRSETTSLVGKAEIDDFLIYWKGNWKPSITYEELVKQLDTSEEDFKNGHQVVITDTLDNEDFIAI